MSEIIYFESENPKGKILDNGKCFGFNYYIISYGTHPCCYVEIPKYHIFYKKNYTEDIYNKQIDAHGGITYSRNYLPGIDESGFNWYIGWDYAHYGDYQLFGKINDKVMEHPGHKWNIEELRKEVFNMCKQLWEIC